MFYSELSFRRNRCRVVSCKSTELNAQHKQRCRPTRKTYRTHSTVNTRIISSPAGSSFFGHINFGQFGTFFPKLPPEVTVFSLRFSKTQASVLLGAISRKYISANHGVTGGQRDISLYTVVSLLTPDFDKRYTTSDVPHAVK